MTGDGAQWGSIYAMRQGVFTRGMERMEHERGT
jgi:hypothetical protein